LTRYVFNHHRLKIADGVL